MENIKEGPALATTNSVQEPNNEDTAEVTVLTLDIKTKFRLTLELPVMFAIAGSNITSLVQTDLFEEQTCLYSELAHNTSVDCYNMTATELAHIQPDVANLLMFKNLIETLVSLVFILFLGPWSDMNGRIPLFLLSISGMLIQSCMFCVFSTMPELPPITFLLCSLPLAFCGGREVLSIASSCYIVDITDFKTRALRFGVLHSFIYISEIIGSFLGPFLYSKSPTYAYALSSMLIMTGLLYTQFFLKESAIIKEGVSTKLFNLGLVKEMWNTVLKKRFGFLRSIIILSTVGLTLNFMIYLGESSLFYMYLQKQFSWKLKDYTQLKAYIILLSAIVPVFVLFVFNTKLKIPDMHLATAAILLLIVEEICKAYSVHKWQIYAAQIFGCAALVSLSLVQCQLSKIFPSEDLGKIYTFKSILGQLGTLIVMPLYTTVYNTTINNFSNFIFFFSSIIGLFVFTIYATTTYLLSKSVESEDLLIEH